MAGHAVPTEPVYTVLGRMLFKIGAVQLLGAMTKTAGIMPATTEWGIGAYLGRIALPSLLFGALARLDVSTLDLVILSAILIASIMIWVLAAGIGLLVTRQTEFVGERQMTCALLALFVTMGDDIGMGYPLLSAMA